MQVNFPIQTMHHRRTIGRPIVLVNPHGVADLQKGGATFVVETLFGKFIMTYQKEGTSNPQLIVSPLIKRQW